MSSCMYAHHVTRCCGRSAIARRTFGTKPSFSSGLSQSSRACRRHVLLRRHAEPGDRLGGLCHRRTSLLTRTARQLAMIAPVGEIRVVESGAELRVTGTGPDAVVCVNGGGRAEVAGHVELDPRVARRAAGAAVSRAPLRRGPLPDQVVAPARPLRGGRRWPRSRRSRRGERSCSASPWAARCRCGSPRSRRWRRWSGWRRGSRSSSISRRSRASGSPSSTAASTARCRASRA